MLNITEPDPTIWVTWNDLDLYRFHPVCKINVGGDVPFSGHLVSSQWGNPLIWAGKTARVVLWRGRYYAAIV